jgi:hypothetical protein
VDYCLISIWQFGVIQGAVFWCGLALARGGHVGRHFDADAVRRRARCLRGRLSGLFGSIVRQGGPGAALSLL